MVSLPERKLNVKLKLLKEDWDDDLKDSETSKYKMLSETVKTSVSENLLLVYNNITLVCSVEYCVISYYFLLHIICCCLMSMDYWYAIYKYSHQFKQRFNHF